MQAIRVLNIGGPEVMTLREVATPVPAAGQVLINIAAGGVQLHRPLCPRRALRKPASFTPGQEAAGTVAAVGEGVTTVKKGEPRGMVQCLGHICAVRAGAGRSCSAIPDGVSFEAGSRSHATRYDRALPGPYRVYDPSRDEILIHAGAEE